MNTHRFYREDCINLVLLLEIFFVSDFSGGKNMSAEKKIDEIDMVGEKTLGKKYATKSKLNDCGTSQESIPPNMHVVFCSNHRKNFLPFTGRARTFLTEPPPWIVTRISSKNPTNPVLMFF